MKRYAQQLLISSVTFAIMALLLHVPPLFMLFFLAFCAMGFFGPRPFVKFLKKNSDEEKMQWFREELYKGDRAYYTINIVLTVFAFLTQNWALFITWIMLFFVTEYSVKQLKELIDQE
jgi:hypothetical protein